MSCAVTSIRIILSSFKLDVLNLRFLPVCNRLHSSEASEIVYIFHFRELYRITVTEEGCWKKMSTTKYTCLIFHVLQCDDTCSILDIATSHIFKCPLYSFIRYFYILKTKYLSEILLPPISMYHRHIVCSSCHVLGYVSLWVSVWFFSSSVEGCMDCPSPVSCVSVARSSCMDCFMHIINVLGVLMRLDCDLLLLTVWNQELSSSSWQQTAGVAFSH